MTSRDSLQRFTFEHAAIRGEIVHLDATWQAVLDRRPYPAVVHEILGELMAAAALLSATIAFDGSLTLQVQGDGPLKLLVVECTSERAMRALAQWTGDVVSAPLMQLVGDARLAITIDPKSSRERFQGVVSLEGERVARALENYFARSEQLDTRLWLAADARQAAGMLLQRLPGPLDADPDAWTRAVRLGSTLTRDELLTLSVREILHRLYHEEDIRLFSRKPVSFRCSCSRERVESVLRMLGRDEVQSILDAQGAIDVRCEFCGSRYHFDQVDAGQLFASPVAADASPTRH